ncbi:hypothetical protein, partial [Bilophila wadsworthia]
MQNGPWESFLDGVGNGLGYIPMAHGVDSLNVAAAAAV